MNASHTPGPWNLDETTGVNMAPVYLIESAEGQSIATVKKQADALLIRSAPTLLAQRDELREALNNLLVKTEVNAGAWFVLHFKSDIDRARAALINSKD